MIRIAPLVALALGMVAPRTVAAQPRPSAPPGTAEMRIYRDPETGRLGSPPPGATVREEPAGEAPAEPLVEEPGETPAGGVTVDLKGRFRGKAGTTARPTGEAGSTGAPGQPAR